MAEFHTKTTNQVGVCPFCEANCGIVLEIDTENQKIVSARGDKDDPFSIGFVCA